MKKPSIFELCLSGLVELGRCAFRREDKLGEIKMKLDEIGGVVDTILANVGEASTEILALLEDLHQQLANAQTLSPEVVAKFEDAIAKTRALADIVPNAPTAPAVEPTPVVEEVPAVEPTPVIEITPVEETPAQ